MTLSGINVRPSPYLPTGELRFLVDDKVTYKSLKGALTHFAREVARVKKGRK